MQQSLLRDYSESTGAIRASTARTYPRPSSSVHDIIDKFKKTDLAEEAKIQERLRPSVPKRMSAKRKAKVTSYAKDRSAVFTCGTQEVRNDSLNRLVGPQWLDDEVINFYGVMLQQRSDAAVKAGDKAFKNIYYLNSFFYQKLSEQGYEKAKLARWTKRSKVDIFAKDAVVFPINLGNMHWTAGVINVEKKRLEYYDSMGDSGGRRYQVFEVGPAPPGENQVLMAEPVRIS